LKVGVVIVNYNGGSYIGDCLRSLRTSTHAPFAIVCVDNDSTDGSAELVASQFPEVTLIRARRNTGFTGGVNLGTQHCLAAGHDAILLLNPDAVVEADAIEQLVAAAARHPNAILAPAVRRFDRPDESCAHAGTIWWWCGRVGMRKGGEIPDPTGERRLETADGCCLLVPAAVFQRAGLLDDAYFLYFEDADFLERATSARYEVWQVPSSLVRHRESSATGGRRSPIAMYYFIRNRHYFVRKHRRGRPVYYVFLAYSSLDVIARAGHCMLTGRSSLARAILRGALDGWLLRMGKRNGFQIER
jgi:GT2 family glycosyltransferase